MYVNGYSQLITKFRQFFFLGSAATHTPAETKDKLRLYFVMGTDARPRNWPVMNT